MQDRLEIYTLTENQTSYSGTYTVFEQSTLSTLSSAYPPQPSRPSKQSQANFSLCSSVSCIILLGRYLINLKIQERFKDLSCEVFTGTGSDKLKKLSMLAQILRFLAT